MQKHIYTYIQFKPMISSDEIMGFRGAILNMIPDQVLFHNHIDTGFRYAYPLIQYKQINNHACIVGIDKGVKALTELQALCPMECALKDRIIKLEIKSVQTESFLLEIVEEDNATSGSCYYYKLKDWLPLNQSNYRKYLQMPSLVSRIELLEHILIGNVISFAGGIGHFIDKNLFCDIISIDSQHKFYYKDVELQSMDITFRINLKLPPFIGLGKSASVGRGILYPIKKR